MMGFLMIHQCLNFRIADDTTTTRIEMPEAVD